MLDAVMVSKDPAAFLFFGASAMRARRSLFASNEEGVVLAFRQSQNCRIAGRHSMIGAPGTHIASVDSIRIAWRDADLFANRRRPALDDRRRRNTPGTLIAVANRSK